MTVQYCSDLHLEFPENHKYITRHPIPPVGEILVLAGDIVSFAVMEKRKDFFNYLADNFLATYWIPGNHEYYDGDISDRSGSFQENIRSNVFLVNNRSFLHGSTKIILSTLWSAVSEVNKWKIENYISDFKTIRDNGKPFSIDRFNQLHNNSLRFITAELEHPAADNSIVVTHHVPTFMHYPKKYKGDVLNEVFAVDLATLIEATKPNYWIYGHHHSNTPPFVIGATTMLTNQLGYVHHYEHGSFNDSSHIIVQ